MKNKFPADHVAPAGAPYPWQKEQWDYLHGARRQNRMPHALLLRGPAGAGIREFAMEFGATLLCEAQTRAEIRCGQCRSCLLYHSGNHPDLALITPEAADKPIKIDQIRGLIRFVALKSHYGHHKCAVLEPAEKMNVNAANSLLKTLEEPPPDTLLLLVCHLPALLPVTIRSRCQILDMRATLDAAKAWLGQHLGTEHDADELLDLANNAPLAALELSKGEIQTIRVDVLSDLEGLFNASADPVRVAEKWHRIGTEEVLSWLSSYFQDMVRLKFVRQGPYFSNADGRKCLQALAKRVDLAVLFDTYDRIMDARTVQQGQSNVNMQSLLEELTIHWSWQHTGVP